jgi:hypothetical protein
VSRPDVQGVAAWRDAAGDCEGFAGQRVGLIVGAGVTAVEGAGEGGLSVAGDPPAQVSCAALIRAARLQDRLATHFVI